MSKKSLIIVHGMGNHTEESVMKEVTDALGTVFSRYESLKSKSPASEIDLSIFAYDNNFEEYRKAAENRTDIANALKAASWKDGGLLKEFTTEIENLGQSIIEDKYFNTHWLDVLLYRFSLLAEPIQLKLAEKIATEVGTKGGSNVHIIGHSLGSSILHDSLSRLYGTESSKYKLSISTAKINSIHMIANVSRLLQSFRKVGSSEVRPVLGCCMNYIEYRHKLDPIPQIKPFNPTNNEDWVPHDIWQSNYKLIEPTSVTSANVHGLSHYLLDPMVHLPLLKALIRDFRPLVTERKAAEKLFNETTLKGKARALQGAIETIDFSEQSIKNLFESAIALKNMVNSFGEHF